MMDANNKDFTPMVARGTLIYLGRSGGFDVRDCPEPEALAAFIVASCNAAAIAPPVAARGDRIQESLVSMYRYKALPRTVTPGGPIMATITEIFESEADNTRIIIETSNGGASLWAEKLSAPVATGSVDIAELRLMLIDHRHSDSRKEQDRHLDSIIYFVNAWAAQHVANAIKDQKERAEKAEARMKELEAAAAHKQSIIDRLMLEYCPDEMTAEQTAEWASHQKRAE